MDIIEQQLQEENYYLLRARMLLSETKNADWFFAKEREFKVFLSSLTIEDIKKVADVGVPLFEIDWDHEQLATLSAEESEIKLLDETAQTLYEANLIILANRWSAARDGDLDEIRYNTKKPVFNALKKSTFRQVQLAAQNPSFVSKPAISLQTLQRLVMDTRMSREHRQFVVINN